MYCNSVATNTINDALMLMITFGGNKSPKLAGSAVGDGSDGAVSDVSVQVVAVVGALG